jgi:hypothetical protein
VFFIFDTTVVPILKLNLLSLSVASGNPPANTKMSASFTQKMQMKTYENHVKRVSKDDETKNLFLSTITHMFIHITE